MDKQDPEWMSVLADKVCKDLRGKIEETDRLVVLWALRIAVKNAKVDDYIEEIRGNE